MIYHFSVITIIFITDLSLLNNNNMWLYVSDMVVIVDFNKNKMYVLCSCLVGILFILCSNFHWMSFKVTTVVLKVYILYQHLRYKIYCTDFSTCCTSLLYTKKGYFARLASPKAAFKFASSGLRSKFFFFHVVCSFYLFILDCDLLVSFSCF